MTHTTAQDTKLLFQVRDIVAAFVANNTIAAAALPAFIVSSHEALRALSGTMPQEAVSAMPLIPAVPVKKSVTPDHLVCLECGKSFVSIKRHLANEHKLVPEQYRQKWKLPSDYPMVAPAYSTKRSALAKQSGLGRDRVGRRAKNA